MLGESQMSRDWDIGFGRKMFENIDREFAEAEEMLNRMFRTIRETSPSLATLNHRQEDWWSKAVLENLWLTRW
jgi:hypothetical protein